MFPATLTVNMGMELFGNSDTHAFSQSLFFRKQDLIFQRILSHICGSDLKVQAETFVFIWNSCMLTEFISVVMEYFRACCLIILK